MEMGVCQSNPLVQSCNLMRFSQSNLAYFASLSFQISGGCRAIGAILCARHIGQRHAACFCFFAEIKLHKCLSREPIHQLCLVSSLSEALVENQVSPRSLCRSLKRNTSFSTLDLRALSTLLVLHQFPRGLQTINLSFSAQFHDWPWLELQQPVFLHCVKE